ncbi:MAG: hypothetical protein OXI76_00135 [Gemmatimonadota bacterium]|nr:hypothetical protein [Gemmatimonadota bacterium]
MIGQRTLGVPGRVIALAACLGVLAPMSAAAQRVVEIDDEIACDACAIETGPPVTLAPPDELWFSSLSALRVVRDSEGHYIAAPVEGDEPIAVFGPDGVYRSSYGRIGGGPGEFASNTPLLIEVGEGDVLFAMDLMNLHTLAPRADSSLGQARMPVVPSGNSAVLRSGIAVEATEPTSWNTTVRLVRPDGTIDESVGAFGTGTDAPESGLRHVLGRSNDHMDLWSAPVRRYILTRYGPDGEATTRIERNSTWFRESVAFGARSRSIGRTAVSGIHQDADGLLWVAVSRPEESSSPLTLGLSGRGEVPVDPSLDLNRILNTTVEVIDPVAGQVIARRDFDERLGFVRTPGDDVWVHSLRADEFGGFECIVTPLVLQRG